MDKQSIYELQKIDCNCNDCKHLFRLLDKQNNVLEKDKISDKEMFYSAIENKSNRIKENINSLIKNKEFIEDVGRKIYKLENKLSVLSKEKYGYQGKKAPIQYGVCCRFNKEIKFIANVCQLETQNCFEHRKTLS